MSSKGNKVLKDNTKNSKQWLSKSAINQKTSVAVQMENEPATKMLNRI